jgi:hypothetical protein
MKKFTLFLILLQLNFCFEVYSKTNDVLFNFSIKTFDQDTRKNLENISIDIYENGELMKTLYSGTDGMTYYRIKLDKEYELVVNSGNSYIEKRIIVNTKDIDLSSWKYSNRTSFVYDYQLEIKLFKKEYCEDFKFLKNEPIIHLKYDEKKRDMVDLVSSSISGKIEKERKKRCDNFIRIEF